jgi:S-adenosylmethionine decarboxylase
LAKVRTKPKFDQKNLAAKGAIDGQVREYLRAVPDPDSPDHFVEQDGIRFAGRHLIIDLWGGQGFDDRDRIEHALRDCVTACRATLLHIHLHTFGDGGGVSGVAVLAESHISVHTWPEHQYAAFDVFMCGDTEPDNAVQILKSALESERVTVTEHKRGIL